MKRVASLQEAEVVRATQVAAAGAGECRYNAAAAAAGGGSGGTPDQAAGAGTVPQALLERWRGEVFRLLLQQRNAPIAQREAAREAKRVRPGRNYLKRP